MNISNEILEKSINKLITEYHIAYNKWTEKQLVSCIKQILLSGDIEKHVYMEKEALVYIPYAREQYLQSKIDALTTELNEAKETIDKLSI